MPLTLLLAVAFAVGSPAASDEMIRQLVESRVCTTNPDNGYMACRFQLENLRFTWSTVPDPTSGLPLPSLAIDELALGRISVAFIPGADCASISATTERGDFVAAVLFDVTNGKLYRDQAGGRCTLMGAQEHWEKIVRSLRHKHLGSPPPVTKRAVPPTPR